MKHTKKLFALVLCIVLALSLAVPAFAVDTGTITITPPTGVDAEATNTYKIYKVFDATVSENGSISYKLVSGKTTTPAGFTVDTAGNVTYAGTEGATELTEEDIKAIADYVTGEDPVETVTTTGTAEKKAVDLPFGYYYITTSTGSVVAISSTNPDATVTDKNTVPTVDKTITVADSCDDDGKKALAQVGTDVEFTATITVGNGAKGYVFHDTMESSLSYNDDVTVTVEGNSVNASPNTFIVEKVDNDTFTITFVDSYLATLEKGTEIVITYSATVTSDALTSDPAKNTAYVSYGQDSSYDTIPVETEVYNAQFTVTKKDGADNALEGAGFVIKNAAGKYYKLENKVVSWVDSIDDATEHTSDAQGAVPAFTGLANGTYTLEEKTVPAGYNKAADSTFTIAAGDYTTANLEQAAIIVNNAGSILPSTGGIGTTIFYIVGGLLAVGAAVLLITKKRMSAEG